jgi:DNA polymerase, archaea type
VTYRELDGPGKLRYLASASDARTLSAAVLEGATRRLGRPIAQLRDLGKDAVLALRVVMKPPVQNLAKFWTEIRSL